MSRQMVIRMVCNISKWKLMQSKEDYIKLWAFCTSESQFCSWISIMVSCIFKFWNISLLRSGREQNGCKMVQYLKNKNGVRFTTMIITNNVWPFARHSWPGEKQIMVFFHWWPLSRFLFLSDMLQKGLSWLLSWWDMRHSRGVWFPISLYSLHFCILRLHAVCWKLESLSLFRRVREKEKKRKI